MKKEYLTTLSDDRRVFVFSSKSGDPAHTAYICLSDPNAPDGFRYLKFHRYAANTAGKGKTAAALCEEFDFVEPLGYLLPHPPRRRP